MVLSARLNKAASLAEPGYVIADIGTDHAYLPIWLVQENICPSAIAMDVRKGPLERAADNIRMYKMENRIQVRLSDGLKELRPGEVQCVVLAGMGGPLIRDILETSAKTAHSLRSLILQPQSEAGLVRHYLFENGYVIDAEEAVWDAGKYYQMFRARPLGSPDDAAGFPVYSEEEDFLYGKILIDTAHPVLESFLHKQEEKAQALFDQLNGLDSDRAAARQKELMQDLSLIRTALVRINEAK